MKVMQARQAIDTPENDTAVKPAPTTIDLTSSSSSQSRGKTLLLNCLNILLTNSIK
jgi:hypothetical protein